MGIVAPAVRIFVRLTVLASVAALGLTGALMALAPQARALWGAGSAIDASLDLDPLAQRSVVYARDGSVLAVLHAEENRAPVPLSEIPPHVVRIILAVEDENFYEHGGVNLRATARALFSNVSAGEVLQGGSTVTQQVVKNAILSPEKNLDRKMREALLAWRLEHETDKAEILERYLNTVYFGNGAYGVQAGAETYFGVSAADLTVGQTALLAAMIRNPVGYDPLVYPELAGERRDLVLDRLVDVGYLSAEEAETHRAEPLPATRHTVLPPPDDYFVEAVKQALLDDRRLGETPGERFNAVFRGGLRIHTTLDSTAQVAADAAVEEHLPDTDGAFTAALVSVEPGTGAVRALVGGPGFERAKYNLATQGRRQPGSSFKPLVLAAAVEGGISPKDTIQGSGPCTFRLPGLVEPWRVENYGNSRGSTGSIAAATHKSLNCAYARLGLIVGLDEVVETARDLGIRGDLDPVAAISLGTEEVTPLEMASAYATFAADGVRHEPYFVERVEDSSGDVVLEHEPNGDQVIEQNTARLVTDTLEGVVRGGTGTKARLVRHTAAGKTGTAQDHSNAWFVGYTRQLSTAVWMGAPEGNVPMRSVGGIRVTGGSYPASIWKAFMEAALADAAPLSFSEPDWSELDRPTYLRLPKEYGGFTPRRRPRPVATAPPAPGPVAPEAEEPSDGEEPKPKPKPEPKPSPTTTSPPTTSPPTTSPPTTSGGDGGGGTT